jgi:hypothetical protein
MVSGLQIGCRFPSLTLRSLGGRIRTLISRRRHRGVSTDFGWPFGVIAAAAIRGVTPLLSGEPSVASAARIRGGPASQWSGLLGYCGTYLILCLRARRSLMKTMACTGPGAMA